MKSLSRDPTASARARKAEAAADAAVAGGGFSIKPISLSSSSGAGGSAGAAAGSNTSGFKKGGFKNAFTRVEGPEEDRDEDGDGRMDVDDAPSAARPPEGDVVEKVGTRGGDEEEEEEEEWERWGDYDPRRPTECGPGCPGWMD